MRSTFLRSVKRCKWAEDVGLKRMTRGLLRDVEGIVLQTALIFWKKGRALYKNC